jgi:hypothetical protein
MKKKIIAMSLCAGISLFAEMGINDLELLGQNVLKNNADIKQLKIDLEEIKQKLVASGNIALKTGDKILQVKTNNIFNKSTEVKENLFYKAIANAYIRNSPSPYSNIVGKVQKDQIVKKVVFESTYKIDTWIFVGNGFVKKSLFTEVANEN